MGVDFLSHCSCMLTFPRNPILFAGLFLLLSGSCDCLTVAVAMYMGVAADLVVSCFSFGTLMRM